MIDGGTAPHFCFAMSLAGAPNVGDSMAAIQKWVFEKKALTLAQIEQALNADFEGYDDVRSLLLRAPKCSICASAPQPSTRRRAFKNSAI